MPYPEGTFANIQISKESRKQSAHYLPCNHNLQQAECGMKTLSESYPQESPLYCVVFQFVTPLGYCS